MTSTGGLVPVAAKFDGFIDGHCGRGCLRIRPLPRRWLLGERPLVFGRSGTIVQRHGAACNSEAAVHAYTIAYISLATRLFTTDTEATIAKFQVFFIRVPCGPVLGSSQPLPATFSNHPNLSVPISSAPPHSSALVPFHNSILPRDIRHLTI